MPQELHELLDLSGQVALVTGASRGIGRSIAEVFHCAGAGVALVSRSAEPLEELAGQLGDRAISLVADVAEEAQVNAVVEKTLEAFGRIDILINNAAQTLTRPESWTRRMHKLENTAAAQLGDRARETIRLPARRVLEDAVDVLDEPETM